MKKKKKNISITEVIIAIIVIGIVLEIVLGGIHTTRYNSAKKTIAQIQEYQSATKVFHKKYGQLPGDIKKTIVLGLSTYNTDGNENGIIEDSNNKIKKISGEITNFWLHLSNAGLLNLSSNKQTLSKSSLPKVTNRNFGIIAFGKNNTNYLQIGVVENGSNIIKTENSLKPIEAFIIDKKLDDALPRQGKIVAAGGNQINQIDKVNKNCATNREYLIKLHKHYCQVRIEIDIEK